MGVKIGFVDTGLNPALSDFIGRIDPASRDVAGDRPMGDSWGHGTAVASIAAGAKDDSGMQGVAFNATIIMMRADEPGSCPNNCSFKSGDVAEGIDAARQAGARVINLSIGGSEASSAIKDAVRRATNAGLIVVIGAGNDGSANPTGLARELAAIAPGQVIIVGALGVGDLPNVKYDQMVSYSNRAGSNINSFLAAPGFLVRVAYGEGSYDIVSGTSFAAPVVAGAVALIAQAFPSLTAQQIVSLLYITADDLGTAGADAVFGYGRINIGRAFQPVGTTKLAGTSIGVSTIENGTVPAAAGDAMDKGSFGAVILDEYARAFKINLAATLQHAEGQRPLEQALGGGTRTSESDIGPIAVAMTVYDTRQSRQQFAFSPLSIGPADAESARLLAALAVAKLGNHGSLALGLRSGLNELHRRLTGTVPRAFMITSDVAYGSGFNARSAASIALRQDVGRFAVTFAAETGAAQNKVRDRTTAQYNLSTVVLERRFANGRLAIAASRLSEDRTVLGGQFGAAFGEPGATTHFFDANAAQVLGDNWLVTGNWRRGWTSFTAGSFVTSAYSLDLAKSGVFGSADYLLFRISQPLRVGKGGFVMSLPSSYDYPSQAASYSQNRFSLSPSAREIAAEAGYTSTLGKGTMGANLFARVHPGHVSKASPDVGGAVRFRLRM